MMHSENLFLQQFGVEFPFNFCLFLLLLFLCDDNDDTYPNGLVPGEKAKQCQSSVVSSSSSAYNCYINIISHVRTINFLVMWQFGMTQMICNLFMTLVV